MHCTSNGLGVTAHTAAPGFIPPGSSSNAFTTQNQIFSSLRGPLPWIIGGVALLGLIIVMTPPVRKR